MVPKRHVRRSKSFSLVQFHRRRVSSGRDHRRVPHSLRQKHLPGVTQEIAPRVSMQVFAQPLLAVGDYTDFKELARPRTFEFLEYGRSAGTIIRDPISDEYTVDPDITRDDDAVFSFDNPDFNLKSLKLNAVFRWEVKPGSNMYVVWTRQQVDEANPGRFALGRDARRLFGASAALMSAPCPHAVQRTKAGFSSKAEWIVCVHSGTPSWSRSWRALNQTSRKRRSPG